jgi:hypothetical protein
MAAATKLIDRLDRVIETRPGHYVAGCPCCRSKTKRSLSVREFDDGRWSLHPLCGCETDSVLDALGLAWADLYPAVPSGSAAFAGGESPSFRPSTGELIWVLDEEACVVADILAEFLKRRTLGEEQWQRLAKASTRITRARRQIHGR